MFFVQNCPRPERVTLSITLAIHVDEGGDGRLLGGAGECYQIVRRNRECALETECWYVVRATHTYRARNILPSRGMTGSYKYYGQACRRFTESSLRTTLFLRVGGGVCEVHTIHVLQFFPLVRFYEGSSSRTTCRSES